MEKALSKDNKSWSKQVDNDDDYRIQSDDNIGGVTICVIWGLFSLWGNELDFYAKGLRFETSQIHCRFLHMSFPFLSSCMCPITYCIISGVESYSYTARE
jgi:hypothetical protein